MFWKRSRNGFFDPRFKPVYAPQELLTILAVFSGEISK